ncbi:MAG: hypothetical protein A2831_00210 [Candidatus Yanofskybacteria bacterium RIFCSPHIGHO2_01_FULL_44_17]|uniref:CAAX prenyl protease 2/Lysostaphin resistance protein A-like domain-containing protein n=1 Tax=Candidatus Yanofskybacteria bacterium RIFCSPHIGHO2_01_FULL_44_17 TaxID=1802668 RepID=A0A1F8EW67_9BACT|nr:MAG: hypothetical protein A2831_00210 [Candidatus Yanofskybacteria bacterium RIFCSPHIGHO2_01_FULL_44_17]
MVSKPRKRSKWAQLFWAVLFYILFVGAYWKFGMDLENYGPYYLLIVGGMAGINGFYGEGLKEIGLWPKNFRVAFYEFGWLLLTIAAIVSCLGILFGQARFSGPGQWLEYFLRYCAGGLFQQYLLNGFFVNRLVGFLEDDKNPHIPLIAGSFFALAHFPNWFLMIVTFFAGWACSAIFLRSIEAVRIYIFWAWLMG